MKTEKVVRQVTDWLRDYVTRSGTTGFVVGVSGGIDSAVTSTLGALTGLPLLCVEMPIHQSPNQTSRARDHIEWMLSAHANVDLVEVALTSVFDEMLRVLPEIGDASSREMSLVNTRARLRMATLYYFAALDGRLVLGTGNKVEDFGIGFFTKYGDGGVDLSPIADLVKTEVYALGRELGIIESIMTAAPTDGLWGDDRTDEDQIGASYPELEWAMAFSGEEAALAERQRQVLAIYRRYNAANKHKMEPIPVCRIPANLRT